VKNSILPSVGQSAAQNKAPAVTFKQRLALAPTASLWCRRFAFEDSAMHDRHTPHFHNQPGVPKVRIGAREFMCIGALPPFDHPHIFIDMGDATEAICPYCSTLFVYDASLEGHSIPAECEVRPEVAA
jgi:uncharacterized Zn-finger protein